MRNLVVTVTISSLLAVSLAAQPRWPVERGPFVAIPATRVDGTPQYGTASWATRLANGEIAIADGTEGNIRIADTTGRLVRTIGGRGQGPGEFQVLTWVGRCGDDSLHAWDARTARLSVFGSSGAYVRHRTIASASSSFAIACSRAGILALFTGVSPRRGGGDETMRTASDGRQYRIGSLSADLNMFGSAEAPVATVRGVMYGEMLMGQLTPGGGMGAVPRPLGEHSSFAFVGDLLAVGSTDSLLVRLFDATGTPRAEFRVQASDAVPTPTQYERAIEPVIAIAPAPMRPQLAEFARLALPPTRMPAFSRLLGSPDGLVWLVVSADGEPITRLRAYRTNGDVVAILELAHSVAVFEVGTDYVLGREVDPDGEERVVAYRFARR